MILDLGRSVLLHPLAVYWRRNSGCQHEHSSTESLCPVSKQPQDLVSSVCRWSCRIMLTNGWLALMLTKAVGQAVALTINALKYSGQLLLPFLFCEDCEKALEFAYRVRYQNAWLCAVGIRITRLASKSHPLTCYMPWWPAYTKGL